MVGEHREKILVIVPCGKRKIWDNYPNAGPTEARRAYVGSPFKVNCGFAEKFADRWIILSAKYGFVDPDFLIPHNYNVTFKEPATNPISLAKLRTQLKEKGLDGYETVIVLGGKDYAKIVRTAFSGLSIVKAPTEGLPIIKAMSLVKSLTQLERSEMLRRIGLNS